MKFSGKTVVDSVRIIFGIFMVCVYVGMALGIALDFFPIPHTPFWTAMKWISSAVLAAYGLWRGWRMWKGIDYYVVTRKVDDEDDEQADDKPKA